MVTRTQANVEQIGNSLVAGTDSRPEPISLIRAETQKLATNESEPTAWYHAAVGADIRISTLSFSL